MKALLELLAKLFPSLTSTALYQGLSILALVLTIFGSVYGVYSSVNANLDKHIHDRDIQVGAIELKLSVAEKEISLLLQESKNLHDQDIVIEKQIHSALEQRVGRLESHAMEKR
jgi:hypothetical protein